LGGQFLDFSGQHESLFLLELGPDNPTSWARALRGEDQHLRSTKRADGFSCRLNSSQQILPGRVFGCAEQVDKNKDCAQWRAYANYPAARHEIRRDWNSPEKCAKNEKYKQSSPFKGTPRLGADMGLTATRGAYPAFPKPKRQDRDPKCVSHVKRAYLYRATPFPTREAVVIAKS